MEGKEKIAQEALNYLSLAQKFEEEKNLEKAIESYQLAADYLKNSGYLIDRVSDIYSKIEELKEFAKQELIYAHASVKSQIEQVQDQAFSLLDGAQKLESDGFLEDAINQYMSATKLLVQAGWSESQLANLKEKLTIIADKIERRKLVQRQEDIETQQLTNVPIETKPQIVSAFGKKRALLKKKN